MRKIDYNIASSKSVNLGYFVISIFSVFILSVLLVYLGANKISNTNTGLKQKIDQKNFYKSGQRNISENKKLFGDRIGEIKGKWDRRIKFSNTVIKNKTFPFLRWMNYFERILPDMVQINEIILDSKLKGDVILVVSSYSSEKLYDFYKKLIENNLVIASESEKDGVFKSKLKVTLKK